MDSILILVVAIAVLLVVLEPYFSSSDLQDKFVTKKQFKSKKLGVRLDLLYDGLSELQLDYDLGKIEEEDHEKLQNDYKVRIVNVMKELDTIGKTGNNVNMKTRVEAEILRFRKTTGVVASSKTNDCPSCKVENEPENNFCAKCGEKLN